MKLFLRLLLSWLFLHSVEAGLTESQRLVFPSVARSRVGIAISDTAMVIAEYERLNVYGKENADDEWAIQQTIPVLTDIGISYPGFDALVYLEGGTIAVRVVDEDGTSRVLLFGWNGSDWVYTQTITIETPVFILTESIFSYTKDGQLHIITHTGSGQVDTSSEQIITSEEGPGAFIYVSAAQDDLLFTISEDSLYVFKRDDEGLYTLHQQLDKVEDEFHFTFEVSSFGTTLAVSVYDVPEGWTRAVRLYSFETGTLVFQESIPVEDGDADYEGALLVGNDLLLAQYWSASVGVYFEVYGLASGPLSGFSETYYPGGEGIFTPTNNGLFATSNDMFAVSWWNYEVDDIVVQLFDKPSPPRIRTFLLFDTRKDILVSPSLSDGAVYDRKDIGRSLNIKAVTDGSVDSVVFELNGEDYSTDEDFPFMLRDGNPKNHRRVPELAVGGTFTVTATPYSGPGGSGAGGAPSTVTFTLI